MPGIRTAASKLGQLLFVLWAVATILFLMFRLMPGSPTAAFIDPTFTEEQQQALMRQFGLDRPLYEQYLLFVKNLLQFELGESFFFKESVARLILQVFPNTLILTITSLIIAYVIGILLGALIAWKRGTWIEAVGIPVVLTTRAAPEFWVGMILLAVFSFELGWFPSGGAISAGAEFEGLFGRVFTGDFLAHLFLPTMTLALYLHGLPLLLMRSTMIEVLDEDFVTMARMQGFGEWTVVIRHAARCQWK
jgi:peptide/nickel transport system permease protein